MLEITTGDLRFLARFEEELAPNTVAAFRRILPFDDRIRQQAIDTKAMPLSNVTKMTQAERDLLARWIAQGAKIP